VIRALVLGAGGLGGPAALGLAAAGVEQITIVDDDTIDATNLSRQLFYGDADVGRAKADVLAEALQQRFPAIRVAPVRARFTPDSAAELVRAHDVVLDGTDNFPTRFLANDTCVDERKPLIHGAALRWQGQVLAIVPGVTPCLRCLFEGEPPEGAAPTCAEAGVIAPLVGVIGAWMSDAAIALNSIAFAPWDAHLRTLDGWTGRERWVPVGRDPACAACGSR
jgi:molybdopterin/thiamine biosynthesis adenylyltransferase